jgi:carboxylate-amine ligase
MSQPLHLFDAFGVEIEIMIVDATELSVRPIADAVLRDAADEIVSDVEDGEISWSNELAAHVIELKCTAPAPSLEGLGEAFHASALRVNERLAPHGARLLPGGAHPWMVPDREFVRWPHEYGEVYQAFDRIFDCRGHGWSNLQSVHLNLPFQGDEEFGLLHGAIRMVLPLLPALCASTPILERQLHAARDARMAVYKTNARRVPLVSGRVVPEPASSHAEYQARILEPLYRAIAPLDPDGILQHEWLNARGAIARFDRDAIEIRVMDAQEHPFADVARCAAATAVVRALTEGRWCAPATQAEWPTERLAELIDQTIVSAEDAVIADADYLAALGFSGDRARAHEVWQHLFEATGVLSASDAIARPLETYLRHGTLATRLVDALDGPPSDAALHRVWAQLADCLQSGADFVP